MILGSNLVYCLTQTTFAVRFFEKASLVRMFKANRAILYLSQLKFLLSFFFENQDKDGAVDRKKKAVVNRGKSANPKTSKKKKYYFFFSSHSFFITWSVVAVRSM